MKNKNRTLQKTGCCHTLFLISEVKILTTDCDFQTLLWKDIDWKFHYFVRIVYKIGCQTELLLTVL